MNRRGNMMVDTTRMFKKDRTRVVSMLCVLEYENKSSFYLSNVLNNSFMNIATKPALLV